MSMEECKQRVKMWLLMGMTIEKDDPRARTNHRDKVYRDTAVVLWDASEIEELCPESLPD